MDLYLIAFGVGAIIGWEVHRAYLRGLAKTIRKLRRKLVGK